MGWQPYLGWRYGKMIIMKKLSLTNGGYTLLDDEDYEKYSNWNWQNSGGYARRSEYIGFTIDKSGKRKSINKVYALHRVINNTPDGIDTDHINGNKLDNRRCNLRNATRSQNSINRKLVNKGVQLRKDRKKSPFRVYVSHDKKELYVASFKTFEEAAQAYYTVSEQLNCGVLTW